MTDERIYLDHAATTPLRPEALAAMRPWLEGAVGNAESAHVEGRRARGAVAEAKAAIAALVGAAPAGVILTSGATESSNLAVRGASHPRRNGGRRLVTTRIEHAATRKPIEALAADGWQVQFLPVDRAGRVVEDGLGRLITPGTAIVSVIAGHNELGTRQPLAALADAAHAVGALLHLDVVQSAAYDDLADVPWDLLSLSAHKLGGPQGVGALVRRADVPIAPLLLGGSHQGGLRPGTLPVALAAGFAAAVEAARTGREREAMRILELRERFAAAFEAANPLVATLGARAVHPALGLPHVLAYELAGLAGDEAVYALDQAGIAASTASACLSGARSGTLDAIGVAPEREMLRFSLGWTTTEAAIEVAAARAKAALAAMAARAPFERRRGLLASRAAEAGVPLGEPHWLLAEAVYAYHQREGMPPGVRALGRLVPGAPPVETLYPKGLSTLCVWLGLPVPRGGCRPYAG